MQIYIDNQLYDTEIYPVVIVFKNDKERLAHANNLRDNFKPKKGARFYGVGPKNMNFTEMVKKIKGWLKHRKDGGVLEDLYYTDKQRAESYFNQHVQSQKYKNLYLVYLDVNHYRIDTIKSSQGLIIKKYEADQI